MSWKDESEPNIKFCLGRKIDMVQEFITTQKFGHNCRRADGIRIHHIAALQHSMRCLKRAILQNSKDKLSSCRCLMTSYGDLKTMSGNAMLTPTLCLYLQRDSQQDVGHSSDLDPKRIGILLRTEDQEENGIESLN